MGRTAEDYLNVWRGWLGYSEANGKYKKIIDVYNQEKPLPRDYRVSYEDAWCDVTVSAAAIRAGMINLIGRECSCEEHVRIFKEKGIWIEDGNIIPEPGYLIVYNWNDGSQPNDGFSDHIGVVEEVGRDKIICIEGNYKDSVERREIPVGWGYIRGYTIPQYEKEENIDKNAVVDENNDKGTELGNSVENEQKDISGTKNDNMEENESTSLQKSVLKKECSWMGIVTVNSWLNVRRWAGTSYETCSFSPLLNGTEVEVCDSVRDENGYIWYYIKYKGKYGFVHADYVQEK